VNSAPPRGTSYTAASPAPPPQATSSRDWAGDRWVTRASRLPAAPPISFGADSRPRDTPSPMTISDSTDVPRLRRNDSSPLPLHRASSISDLPGTTRRSRYQPIPPITPAPSSSPIRRDGVTAPTAPAKLPAW